MLLFEPANLHQRFGLDGFRHVGRLDLVPELGGHILVGRDIAQLALNSPHLLAQHDLALLAIHAGLGFGLDLMAKREELKPFLKDRADLAQAFDRVDYLE